MKTNTSDIGGKAANLRALEQLGLRVPRWTAIPASHIREILNGLAPEAFDQAIDRYTFPLAFIDTILAQFPGVPFFAVRSSAIDEDGAAFSFAGQFETHLFVKPEQVAENIKKVWKSAYSPRILEYRRHNGLAQDLGIAVIIQEMVAAESAGVAFGINPANGNRKAKVISAVYGLGEGLVSGELDSDNYILENEQISRQIADKDRQFVLDPENGGTKIIEVPEAARQQPVLSDVQILEVAEMLDTCRRAFGKPQDMEFAFAEGKLYALQARPVTNLHKIPDSSAEYMLWDNSNIIESYPGVTTPLTFSFISQSYEGAYKLFSAFMGVEDKVIRQNERVFANTLGLMNGRVYYNLRTWYHMLAMLPGYSINARFMEKMMGVKERFDIPEHYRLSKGAAWWRILKMAVQMYGRFRSLPRRRAAFMALLETTISTYKQINFSEKNAHELMALYLEFERKLLNEWKAPLLNDFFAMIWFGLLQKRCEQYKISDNPNIHNDLLCGSSDIISTQPIHRSIALATEIASNPTLKTLFETQTANEIWQTLQHADDAASLRIKAEIERYILDFGERCIGELKLETVSYTQNPALFVRVLKSYVETGITAARTSGNVEESLRSNAEAELNKALRNKPFKKWRLKSTLHKARSLVSARENLRYERTRAFGIVRAIFSAMGDNWYAENLIDDPRDIFYLGKEEIFAFIEGRAISQRLRETIALRKAEYDEYRSQAAPAERFATWGMVYHANDFYSTGKVEVIEGDLKGVGCCPGQVRARVRVVLNPGEVRSLDGDILVTSSTDPGWVTLFPSASAIIVERGSLLSHSAIVSREMGIPCIVGVTGLLKTLKTGDWVEMDGRTGVIKRILDA